MSAAPLSCYLLTYNAERYLAQVLSAIAPVCDDLLVVDSGSTDATVAIALAHGARVLPRRLDNFRTQRQFALDNCQHRWVLSLDADEVPTPAFVEAVRRLKAEGFGHEAPTAPEAYRLERHWIVLGRPVRAFYPVSSPDYPVRLFRRDVVSFSAASNFVHEDPHGYSHTADIPGVVHHYSCDSVEQLYGKLNRYTTLAAYDMARRGKRATWLKRTFSPVAAWWKWFVVKGSWRDGAVGSLLGHYAYEYSHQKYQKLYFDERPAHPQVPK